MMRDGASALYELPLEVKVGGAEEDGATLEFVASTAAIDRYEEVIEPAGWRLENYRNNPVFLNTHRAGDVAQVLGRAVLTEVRQVNGRPALVQRVQFAVKENPLAALAYGLYRGGYLNAVSVGFIPLRWENGKEGSPWRRRYIEQELVEVSAVAVPGNPEALVTSALRSLSREPLWVGPVCPHTAGAGRQCARPGSLDERRGEDTGALPGSIWVGPVCPHTAGAGRQCARPESLDERRGEDTGALPRRAGDSGALPDNQLWQLARELHSVMTK